MSVKWRIAGRAPSPLTRGQRRLTASADSTANPLSPLPSLPCLHYWANSCTKPQQIHTSEHQDPSACPKTGFMNRTGTDVATFENLTVFISQPPGTYHAFYRQCDFKGNGCIKQLCLLTCKLLLALCAPHFPIFRSHFEKQSKKLQSSSPVQFCSRMSLILGSKKAISTSMATTCGSKQPIRSGTAQPAGWLSKRSLLRAFGNAVLRASASGEPGSQQGPCFTSLSCTCHLDTTF